MQIDQPTDLGARRTVLISVAVGALLTFGVLTALIAPHPATPPVNDLRVQGWMIRHRIPALTRTADVVTRLGWGPVLLMVGSAGALWLWRRRGRARMAVGLLATLGATAGLVALLKISIHRERPSTASLLGSPALDYAFPSGHTTDSAVTYVLLAFAFGMSQRRGRRLLLSLMIGLALLIGASRVYLGYHYLTDVLAGWLLATAVISAAVVVIPGVPDEQTAISSAAAGDRRRRPDPAEV